MATLADFKAVLGINSVKDDALLQACLNDAGILVDDYVGSAPVPDSIMDRAYLKCAANLWSADQNPTGIVNSQFVTTDGQVGDTGLRLARDPLAGVYQLVQRYVLPW